MKDLKIILTASGCPGASTLIRMLKTVPDRRVTVIGTDMDKEAIGRYLCDKFYIVPPGRDPKYIPVMERLLEKEKPDVLFPQSSYEVPTLAKHKEELESYCPVLVSDELPVTTANNKRIMYESLENKVPLPEYYPVYALEDLDRAVSKLGQPFVIKPQVGKGSRGVRIIDDSINRFDRFINHKPNDKHMDLETLYKTLTGKYYELLAMEYLEGMEKTADTLCMKGQALGTTVKTVEKARWGVIVNGELIKDQGIVAQTRKILKSIPLSYCVNIQFIGNRLIEINPRVSTFIYSRDLNPPYLAVRLALGEIKQHEIPDIYLKNTDHGRRMIRYMDQLFIKNNMRVL